MIATLRKQVQQPLRPLEIEAKTMEVEVSFAWDVGISLYNYNYGTPDLPKSS